MKRSWYAAPYAIWMALFTVVPLLFVCYYAFTTKSGAFTTENLTRIFDYAPVLFDSLRLALYCTGLCLLIGYPAAYFMASRDMSRSKSLVVLILLPMWMNFLLRTYAMMTLFEKNGVLNTIFKALRPAQPADDRHRGRRASSAWCTTSCRSWCCRSTRCSKARPARNRGRGGPGREPVARRDARGAADVGAGHRLGHHDGVHARGDDVRHLEADVLRHDLPDGDMIEEFYITMNNRNVGSAMSLVMMVLILISIGFLRKADPEGQGGGIW